MSARTLSWEESPSTFGALAGLGCGLALCALACAGALAAVQQQAWGSLLGLPFGLLCALAAAVLGLHGSRVEVDAAAGEVRRSSRILGRVFRRRSEPLGQPRAVRVVPLALAGRTLYRVQLAGEPDLDLAASIDPAVAAARARELAALLSLPAPEDGTGASDRPGGRAIPGPPGGPR